jgi:2-polyprenyl-6-methoxyphenol hydroxylase-like FAD-dependent oxidoreductase
MQLPLARTRVLISGAGVAGPALACFLQRYGAQVTVVEVAPALRTGGFAVDFRGPTHHRVLRELGVLDALRARRTKGSPMRGVDAAGKEIYSLPAEFAGGELEVYRGDLSRVLYECGAQDVEYSFGERVVGLRQSADVVEVELARAGTRQFELVIGTDGMHSAIRNLAFGPENAFVEHLGYYIAGWSLPNTFGSEISDWFAQPGRTASVNVDQRDPSRAITLCVFKSARTEVDWRDSEAQKAMVKRALSDMPWHVPTLLSTLDAANDLYFDAVSRVSVPRWSEGRVALLGDAAWGVTLGGMGVGTGVVGAYVLAGELAAAGGDAKRAFAAYEQRIRGYAAAWQKGANPGSFLAPATRRGLWFRNTMLRLRVVQWLILRSTQSFATDTDLPDYSQLDLVAKRCPETRGGHIHAE